MVKVNILIVVVLYKVNLYNSLTYNSLLKAFDIKPDIFSSVSCIIYDNSPSQMYDCKENNFVYEYVHNSENGGLAAAYNYALDVSLTNNYDWILLLDQDTTLPSDFMSININNLKKMFYDESVVAVISKVICNNLVISPSKDMFGKILNLKKSGICDFPITAINSGSFIKTSFLKKIGGFNKIFKLDYLDHWLFHTIYSCGKKVFISETIIKHELSVSDFNKYISVERYKNILKAEALFFRLYKSKKDNLLYSLRLLIRIFKTLITVRNKYISLVALKHFLDTISHVFLNSNSVKENKNDAYNK
jgi:GT2 family glycosyltransferase